MPSVPYQPVSQVSPTESSPSGFHISEPPGAFGVGIGQEIAGLGKAVEGAADKIWHQAITLQEMQNAADARKAGADASMEMNLLHAKYGAKQGKDAADALPDYMKSIQEVREKYRAGLKNDMARQHYDSDSYPMMNRTIFSGAAHAASAARQYAIGTTKADNDAAIESVRHAPMDDAVEEDAIRKIERNANADTDIGHLQGPMKDKAIAEGISKVKVARLESMADEAPTMAKDYFMANQGAFHGEDLKRARSIVKEAMYDVQTRVEADKIVDPMRTQEEGKPEKTEAQAVEEARAVAEKQKPGDPIYADRLANAVRARVREFRSAKKEDLGRNTEIVAEAMERTDAKNIDELKADPAAKEAIRNLPAHLQNDISAKINRYQAAKNKPYEDANMRRLTGLRGTDPVAFADLDATKEKLNQAQMQTIQSWQRADRKKPLEFAKTRQAMGWLRDYNGQRMTALKLDKRAGNEDDYDEFAGHVFQALDAWKDLHGKYPDQKEFIEKIGDPLIKQMTRKNWYGGDTEFPAYQQKVPEEFKTWLKDQASRAGKAEPTDRDAALAWSRTQLLKREEERALGKRPAALGE